jgi:cell wall-associated NlpC family hydrolase
MSKYTKYLFLKYKENARGEGGIVDCYGLFLMIQKEIFGRTLPDFLYDCSSKTSSASSIASNLINYPARRTYAPVEGDAVIMETQGVDAHIGVYIGDNKIIHASNNRGVVIEDILEPHIKGRLKYYEIISV